MVVKWGSLTRHRLDSPGGTNSEEQLAFQAVDGRRIISESLNQILPTHLSIPQRNTVSWEGNALLALDLHSINIK